MKDKEFSTSVLYLCLKNLAIVSLFCYLSVFFHHWWIVLFSFIFHSNLDFSKKDVDDYIQPEEKLTHQVRCSFCGEVLHVEDPENCVHREMKQLGWQRVLIENEWKDVCIHCVVKFEEAYKQMLEKKQGGEK